MEDLAKGAVPAGTQGRHVAGTGHWLGGHSASSKAAPSTPYGLASHRDSRRHVGGSSCKAISLGSITSNTVQFRAWGALPSSFLGVLPHWGCWFGPGVVAWIPHTGHSKEGDAWGVKVSGSVECNLGESLHPGQSWTTREQPDLSAHPTEKGNGGQRWDSANPSWTGSGSEESQGGGAPG